MSQMRCITEPGGCSSHSFGFGIGPDRQTNPSFFLVTCASGLRRAYARRRMRHPLRIDSSPSMTSEQPLNAMVQPNDPNDNRTL
jgi:hypothetical protein